MRQHDVAILHFHVAIVSQYTISTVLIMQRKQTELQNLILEMLKKEATISQLEMKHSIGTIPACNFKWKLRKSENKIIV